MMGASWQTVGAMWAAGRAAARVNRQWALEVSCWEHTGLVCSALLGSRRGAAHLLCRYAAGPRLEPTRRR